MKSFVRAAFAGLALLAAPGAMATIIDATPDPPNPSPGAVTLTFKVTGVSYDYLDPGGALQAMGLLPDDMDTVETPSPFSPGPVTQTFNVTGFSYEYLGSADALRELALLPDYVDATPGPASFDPVTWKLKLTGDVFPSLTFPDALQEFGLTPEDLNITDSKLGMFEIHATLVPVPATALLLVSGIAALAAAKRLRRRKDSGAVSS